MLIQSKSKGMPGALAVITLFWVMESLPPLPALLVPSFDTMGCMLSSCVLSTQTFSIHARIQDESAHCSGLQAEQLHAYTDHHSIRLSMLEREFQDAAQHQRLH